jgi:hypothetical protein
MSWLIPFQQLTDLIGTDLVKLFGPVWRRELERLGVDACIHIPVAESQSLLRRTRDPLGRDDIF